MNTIESTRLAGLKRCCMLYAVEIIVFSILYFWVYKSVDNSFSFGTELIATQRATKRTESQEQLEDLNKSLARLEQENDALELLRVDFEKRQDPILVRAISTAENNTIIIYELKIGNYCYMFESGRSKPTGRGGGSGDYAFLDIKATLPNSGSREIAHYALNSSTSLWSSNPLKLASEGQVYRDQINKILSRVKQEYTKVLESIDSEQYVLKTINAADSRIWSYWDFLYFSTITQTTVGYGDILPNSTTVRLLVVTQTILGLIIAVYLVNVAILGNNSAPAQRAAAEIEAKNPSLEG